MADNVTPQLVTAPALFSFRTDDLGGGIQIPYTKLNIGGDGLDVPVVGGQAAMAASIPVVIASDQTMINVAVSGSVAVTGPLTDAQLRAVPVPVSGTVSTGGLTDAQLRASAVPVSTTQLATTLGQKTMANSAGVVIASDQSAIPASQSGTWNVGTVTPGTGATNLGKAEDAVAADGDVGVMALIVRNDTIGTLVNANGDYQAMQANANGSLRVAIEAGGSQIALSTGSDANSLRVGLSNIFATTQNASVPANPIAIGGVGASAAPSAVTTGNHSRVWLDLNGAVINTPRPSTSGGPANVAGSATSVTLIASNVLRKGFTIFNDSSALLYVKFGATASSTSHHVQMVALSYYESPAGFTYNGVIDGIWASATGSARIGEFT